MEKKVCKSCGGTITRKGNFYVCDFCMSKKIKIIITSLVTAVIIAIISVVSVFISNDAKARGYCKLALSDNKEYYIVTDYNSSKTDVIIPSEYKGKPVKEIGYGAFSGCTSLQSIVIPNSVTSIDDYAFEGCDKLTKVNHLGTIDSWVAIRFDGDSANPLYHAKNLYINNQLVTNANIQNATKINNYALYNCDSLTSVTIGNSVISIGNYAFHSSTSLTSVTMGNSVKSIGEYAFNYCESLQSIVIPNSVTSIGYYAFYNCPIENATMPTIAISYMPKSKLKTVVINGGSSIGEEAFYGCTSLTSVTIGNSVTSIGEEAFYGCTSLTSVTIGNSVTSIGEEAFYGCTSLQSIVIPNSVTSIGSFAFYGCDSLTIYCETESKPSGWNAYWNYSYRPVQWGYKG